MRLALPIVSAVLLSGCSLFGGKIAIGDPEGPVGAATLVTVGGERLATDELRLVEIYDRVSGQFETISCARTVQLRERPRRRTPGNLLPRPQTQSENLWIDWFAGHEHTSSRVRYCFYGAPALGLAIPLASSPGAQDSTIHVFPVQQEDPTYPWETLAIQGDTARIGTTERAYVPFSVYAYLHLMRAQGRLAEWLPEAAAAEPFEQERLVVAAAADAWLMMRGGLAAEPDPLLDELVYARETGRLDALLLTRRPADFPEERAAWLAADPRAEERYRAWLDGVFDLTPP